MKDRLMAYFTTRYCPRNTPDGSKIGHSENYIAHILDMQGEDFYKQEFDICVNQIKKFVQAREGVIDYFLKKNPQFDKIYTPIYIDNVLSYLEDIGEISYGEYKDKSISKKIIDLAQKRIDLDFAPLLRLNKEFEEKYRIKKAKSEGPVIFPSAFRIAINRGKLMNQINVDSNGVCSALTVLFLIACFRIELFLPSIGKWNAPSSKKFNQQYLIKTCAKLHAILTDASDRIFINKDKYKGFFSALKILQIIGNVHRVSKIYGVFSLEYSNLPDPGLQELFNILRSHKEFGLYISTGSHAVAVYAYVCESQCNFSCWAEWVFYDPNRRMGATPQFRLDLNQNNEKLQRDFVQWLLYTNKEEGNSHCESFHTPDFMAHKIINISVLFKDDLKAYAELLSININEKKPGLHNLKYNKKESMQLEGDYQILGLPKTIPDLTSSVSQRKDFFKRINRLLTRACIINHYAAVNHILKRYGPFAAEDVSIYECLNLSARYDHQDIFELILAQPGATILLENKLTTTNKKITLPPLYHAVVSGSEGIVELILKYNVDLDMVDLFGTTPLFWAVFLNFPKIVKLLLKVDANPNHQININIQYLLEAVTNNKKQILFDKYVNGYLPLEKKISNSLLYVAARLKYYEIVALLLDCPQLEAAEGDLAYILGEFNSTKQNGSNVTEFERLKNTQHFSKFRPSQFRFLCAQLISDLTNYLYRYRSRFSRATSAHGEDGLKRNRFFSDELQKLMSKSSRDSIEECELALIREIIIYVTQKEGYIRFPGKIRVAPHSGLTYIINTFYEFFKGDIEIIISEPLRVFFKCLFPAKLTLDAVTGRYTSEESRLLIKQTIQNMALPRPGEPWDPYSNNEKILTLGIDNSGVPHAINRFTYNRYSSIKK